MTTRAQAVSPATRAVLDAMCDGEGLTMAVIRHAALEIRAALALPPVADEAAAECPRCTSPKREDRWCATCMAPLGEPCGVPCAHSWHVLPLVAKEPR